MTMEQFLCAYIWTCESLIQGMAAEDDDTIKARKYIRDQQMLARFK